MLVMSEKVRTEQAEKTQARHTMFGIRCSIDVIWMMKKEALGPGLIKDALYAMNGLITRILQVGTRNIKNLDSI